MGNKYSMMKVFHFKDKIDSLPLENPEIQPPLHIRIKPINACNHSCAYCAYRAKDLQLGKDMNISDSIPREKMLEIVDDIINMGVKAITFSGGGEPLFYPHMAEVLRRLASSPVKFATLTNGALLKGEVAEFFALNGSWVRISMDGWDNASYTNYRGCPDGEYDRILSNIRNFKKFDGPCHLGVNYVVDKTNVGHVFEAASRLKDAGVDNLKISACIIDNDGAKNNAYHDTFFDQAREQVARVQEELGEPGFEIFDAYHLEDDCFDKDYSWCPFLQIRPVIGADQNVYSCQDKAYNLDEGLIGSIKDVRFKDFWMNDKEKFFRINPSKICKNHCVANSRNKMLHEYFGTDLDHLGFV
ncbi:radical SAM/SPASM domain-containing protein [Pseudodesulfovibrio sp.]|uniref:radical SAM/SPASM domain-containing protein n=1 Tax=unclassified Pseudodesulfovibrio TaxID=2661612 RepID=UPI003AFF6E37